MGNMGTDSGNMGMGSGGTLQACTREQDQEQRDAKAFDKKGFVRFRPTA